MENIKPKKRRKKTELNARDITIIECIAAGYTDKETAIVLNLSLPRTSFLISEILRTTGAVNRPQLVTWAFKKGILKV